MDEQRQAASIKAIEHDKNERALLVKLGEVSVRCSGQHAKHARDKAVPFVSAACVDASACCYYVCRTKSTKRVQSCWSCKLLIRFVLFPLCRTHRTVPHAVAGVGRVGSQVFAVCAEM